MKPLIKLLSTTAPNVVVNIAYKKILKPQVFKLRPHEIEVLEQAKKDKVQINGIGIQTYKWGNGSKKVLLVHGWEGQAGNFSDIIPSLIDNDYTVYAFDAPSHGFSEQGRTTMFDFSNIIQYMLEKYEMHQIISHSFGSVGTTHCLANHENIQISKYVMLTTPDRFEQRLDDVAAFVGITNKVKTRLVNKLESEFNLKVKDQNVSDFVKKSNVKKALILHDINDKVVNIEQSESVAKAWGDVCELRRIENTGHFRILRTQSIVDQIVTFLD
ncbi:alpha/beta hydrolase [Flammeovirga aprica]|uniref:Alpha/beta hydrolase n=1 Tax=Flammeovirga aprica JL-4 TaxID=694437 RepID=A0A7X9RTS5_9BACT|nr:alpha/beta hydrolase [Flammeovirga aprica]NME67804.1 alpha/beta hydrolase [Flammeovirga aprica JL-4]